MEPGEAPDELLGALVGLPATEALNAVHHAKNSLIQQLRSLDLLEAVLQQQAVSQGGVDGAPGAPEAFPAASGPSHARASEPHAGSGSIMSLANSLAALASVKHPDQQHGGGSGGAQAFGRSSSLDSEMLSFALAGGMLGHELTLQPQQQAQVHPHPHAPMRSLTASTTQSQAWPQHSAQMQPEDPRASHSFPLAQISVDRLPPPMCNSVGGRASSTSQLILTASASSSGMRPSQPAGGPPAMLGAGLPQASALGGGAAGGSMPHASARMQVPWSFEPMEAVQAVQSGQSQGLGPAHQAIHAHAWDSTAHVLPVQLQQQMMGAAGGRPLTHPQHVMAGQLKPGGQLQHPGMPVPPGSRAGPPPSGNGGISAAQLATRVGGAVDPQTLSRLLAAAGSMPQSAPQLSIPQLLGSQPNSMDASSGPPSASGAMASASGVAGALPAGAHPPQGTGSGKRSGASRRRKAKMYQALNAMVQSVLDERGELPPEAAAVAAAVAGRTSSNPSAAVAALAAAAAAGGQAGNAAAAAAGVAGGLLGAGPGGLLQPPSTLQMLVQQQQHQRLRMQAGLSGVPVPGQGQGNRNSHNGRMASPRQGNSSGGISLQALGLIELASQSVDSESLASEPGSRQHGEGGESGSLYDTGDSHAHINPCLGLHGSHGAHLAQSLGDDLSPLPHRSMGRASRVSAPAGGPHSGSMTGSGLSLGSGLSPALTLGTTPAGLASHSVSGGSVAAGMSSAAPGPAPAVLGAGGAGGSGTGAGAGAFGAAGPMAVQRGWSPMQQLATDMATMQLSMRETPAGASSLKEGGVGQESAAGMLSALPGSAAAAAAVKAANASNSSTGNAIIGPGPSGFAPIGRPPKDGYW